MQTVREFRKPGKDVIIRRPETKPVVETLGEAMEEQLARECDEIWEREAMKEWQAKLAKWRSLAAKTPATRRRA